MSPGPEQVAVVGPDGTLMLPAALRRRYAWKPGLVMYIVERDDGIMELHGEETSSRSGAEDDFWSSWWEQARASDDATDQDGN